MNSAEKTKILQLKKEFDHNPEILLAILFGSCANDTARPESDVDIAIKLTVPLDENKKIQLIQLIANIFGRSVDLIDLHIVGEPLLGQIIKNGKVIKGSKQDYTELAIRNVYANEDFLPYIRRSLQARRERWIK